MTAQGRSRRLSISNIAWDVSLDEEVAALLADLGVDCVDVAPGKYFPDFASASDRDVATVRRTWERRGLCLLGMQSLLYGTAGLNVFGSEDTKTALLEHLFHVCRIGAGLGAGKLVFGSPKNRDRTGLDDGEAEETALAFFSRLGDVAAQWGVVVCLEPNPPLYGCNFLTSTRAAFEFVMKLGHPAIRLQLDTGTMFVNEEPPSLVAEVAAAVGHIHLSAPNLRPLHEPGLDCAPLGHALGALGEMPATVEILTGKNTLEDIRASIAVARTCFRTA